jgi:predicted lipid-binding transport protein (Tim44 family)
MTSMLRTTAVALFDDRNRAERALVELRRAGFRDPQIGVAVRDPGAPRPEDATAHTAEAAGFGMLAGASMAGLAAGTLMGLVGGGIVGGLVGALVGLGVPEDEAHYYQRELQAGHAVVTVQSEDRYDEALDVLRRHGGREAQPPQSPAGVGPLP